MWGWFKKDKPAEAPTLPASKHYAGMPTEAIIRVFIPKNDFDGHTSSGELLGHYMKGRRYFLREGNFVLQNLCEKWKSEGKINWEDEL